MVARYFLTTPRRAQAVIRARQRHILKPGELRRQRSVETVVDSWKGHLGGRWKQSLREHSRLQYDGAYSSIMGIVHDELRAGAVSITRALLDHARSGVGLAFPGGVQEGDSHGRELLNAFGAVYVDAAFRLEEHMEAVARDLIRELWLTGKNS